MGGLATRVLYRAAFASIGPGTTIVSPRRLSGVERISIGRDVAAYEGAWLATERRGMLSIADATYVGHDVHLHAIDPVAIGARCVLADGVFIASSDHDRDDRHFVHGAGAIVIADDVFPGAEGHRAGRCADRRRGDGGRRGVVTRDVPAGAVVAGVPARTIG